MTSQHDGTEPAVPEAAPADSAPVTDLGGTESDGQAPEPEPQTPEELAAQWEAEEPDPAGPIANAASAIVVLAVGILGLVMSAALGLGSAAQPQAGTWPFIVSLIISVLALVQLVIGRRGGKDGEKFSRYSLLAGAGFLTLLAMVFLMPRIGFEIPGALLCFVWMKVLGGETWRSATVYSLCIIVAFYLIFIFALGTSIPHLF